MPDRNPEYLVIGRVVAPHGVRGELKVRVESSDPDRWESLERIYLGEERTPFDVLGVRWQVRQALVKLQGVADRNAAEALRGAYVAVRAEDGQPLAENEFYYHQLEGLRVIADSGETLGRLTQVRATGANDVYVVVGASGELLLPAIRQVVLKVDLQAGTMLVHVPEGLR